jgi:hypothetical protein
MATEMTKITTLELQMKHTNEKLDSLDKRMGEGFSQLTGRFDSLCIKIDDNFVRKDTYKIERDSTNKKLALIEKIIYTIAAAIGLAVLGAILSLIFV